MRLKHIHLAGFKSFVDPVTIPAPARLTGIVGPNGCGKSNVIDAVRWVLGESKAKELRGASMQDVIFNGSANRKPASRASVEMLFDNSEGRAAGQWAQYAEISVKRILTRAGESSYHINGNKVRRKDLFDLFLGTGLGGDAYAIIEQGMISRVIESKPEELRGYLEEAAGVSKYKERRKETEARLRDTRDNLSRVEDIRLELARQLEKLGVQAEVARQFFGLDEDKLFKRDWLSLLRKQQAQIKQSELARQQDAARIEIEARTADLRRLEAALEEERLRQFEATEVVNQAQARFYTEGGEVARMEQELRHLHDTRLRLASDLEQAVTRREQAVLEQHTTQAEIEQRQIEQEQAQERAEILSERAAEAGESLPEMERQWRDAQAAVAAVQQEIHQFEQAIQLADSHRQHADRSLQQLKARELRLIQEQEGLTQLDDAHLQRQLADLEEAEERVASLHDYLDNTRSSLPELEAALKQTQQAHNAASQERHRLEAEQAALQKLQARAHQADSEGAAWLAREGLDSVLRLWQCMRVETGWETAVEAALGEAMAALAVEARPNWLASPPEARFELALTPLASEDRTETSVAPAPVLTRLADLIQTDNAVAAGFLRDRLGLAFAAEDLATALVQRGHLPPGGFIATREGHRVTRASVTFNAPEKGHHGLIARMRDIERLEGEVELALNRQDEAAEAVQRAEADLLAGRRQAESLQAQIAQARDQVHQLQVASVRAQEAAKRVNDRHEQIRRELDELYAQLESETEAWNSASEQQREAELEADRARERLASVREARQVADQRYQSVRETQRSVERDAQEATFQVRSIASRLQELAERVRRAEQAAEEFAAAHGRLQAQLEQAEETQIHEALRAALERRQAAEQELTAAREELEGCNARLLAQESDRLKTERALEPLKERLQATELKLQEARLNEIRFAEELEDIDEAALLQKIALQEGGPSRSEAWLKAELDRLDAAIAALGAVNMAALEELKAAQERKNYLDAQALDLETAAATLEEAIRRIDAETRARLKNTFEAVSTEFRRLFTELFGGGEANLILTGDEILDAGLVVMAQPPGKKNSSIHLLSGGEKALTAISLVFAFFRLNPAPFCLLDEVDAPLDDSNTERLARLVTKMAEETQFMFITHNRITMEMAQHLVGVTMPEPGVSRPVAVDVDDAMRMALV